MKKGNREISELAHEAELRKIYLRFVEISILIHQSILACSLARVKFGLETIDTLIINFRRFDLIMQSQGRVLTLLESALRHFAVLKFLLQLI